MRLAIKWRCHKMNKVIKNFKNIKYGPAPEDDNEVLKWINNLPKPNHNFINGEWSKSLSRKTLRYAPGGRAKSRKSS